jgi:hypothetical protein
MLVPDTANLCHCGKAFPEIPPTLPFSKGGVFLDAIQNPIFSLEKGD